MNFNQHNLNLIYPYMTYMFKNLNFSFFGTRMKRFRLGGALMVTDFFWNTDWINFYNVL